MMKDSVKVEYGKVHLVGEHHEVPIYLMVEQNRYFFRVKKGGYEMSSYENCVNKLNYLKALGEPLKIEQ